MADAKRKILTFYPSRSPENGFPALERETNSSWKNIKLKLILIKKLSKVIQFTHFFLRACSVYSHFQFELKK